MKPVHILNIIPALPENLEPLRELAYNLRWSWNHDTIELFRRLDSDLWETCWHNPVLMLGTIDQRRLERAAEDESFLAHLERALSGLREFVINDTNWFHRNFGKADPPVVAYFSAEFGLTECLSIFAGGLGVLAGDHLKSASDLGVPLVGVGLLYQQGYFRQYLNAAGWQQEDYRDNDFRNLPLTLEMRNERPLTVKVRFPGRDVEMQIWKVLVGRLTLYLLDTNIPANRLEDRDVTDQLYGGDLDMRIRQEIVLGIGGVRALEALGIQPTVFHMNEGHSAFLALERVWRLMEQSSLSFGEACQVAAASMIFTTHTPVGAGHDYFPSDLMDRYFGEFIGRLGVSRQQLLGLGRTNPNDPNENFCMTVLALRLSDFRNGVSKLHGKVSRRMWQRIWPQVPEDEIPVGHVTNGVHFRSWISYEMNQLYDRYLGPNWRTEPADWTLWKRVESIPPEELWRTHERRRERLVAFARQRLAQQLRQRGAPQAEIGAAEEALDPEVLTIGFCRRFATYKRATLLLRDKARLARIVNDPQRPVQIIFAGKAHPRDDAGKALIQEIVSLARGEEFRRRIVFLEDYDMAVSRYLVQGADVWLNTPLRPMEASGTSGMKAAANGVLNLSVLDGWWDEAWLKHEQSGVPIGWAIGRGEDYTDTEYQNQVEAESLYNTLESDVVPTFYDRRGNGLPRRWIALMRSSIADLCHFFNTHRMVQEYTERFYLPAHANYRRLMAEGGVKARELAAWSSRVSLQWPQVAIGAVEAEAPKEACVGDRIYVRARVRLGALDPGDVAVELYAGALDADGKFRSAQALPMESKGRDSDGAWLYEAAAFPCSSGQHGLTVRVLPRHPDGGTSFMPGLITWAKS